MASIQSYPSEVVAVSTGLESGNADNCFNNSSSRVIITLSKSFVAGGFNFSNIPNEAVIKALLFTIVGEVSSSSKYFAVRAVKNATSSSSYTDLGDGSITFIQNSTSKQTVTKSFPVAATALTVSQLKNNTLQARFYASGDGYLYELYATVEYEVPSSVITVNAGTGGTVTGGGTYENGTTATLTATANTGYRFKQWSDGNTQNPRSVTVTANATYTAEFEKLTYSVTASASPAEGGTISGAGVYSYGDTATLTAIPNDGYKFVKWSDGVTSVTRSQTVTAAASFTAIFEKAATSNTFRGTSRQTVYRGTATQAVYIGTKKI